MTERCHLIWGRGYSVAQREAMEAWWRDGFRGKEPPVFGERAKGDPMWIFVPGCEAAALEGPHACVCDTLQSRLDGIDSELSEMGDRLGEARRRARAVAERDDNRRERFALWRVIRRRGLGPLAERYLTWLDNRRRS